MNIVATAHPMRRQSDGFVSVTVRAPELQLTRNLDMSFEDLRRFCGWRDPLALDLLLVASLCYVVDKMVERKSAADCWTRELNVTLPVSAPDHWQSAASQLSETLTFLTGDIWNLTFTALSPRHWRSPRRRIRYYDFKADAVCLFSGGLDSLAGAIDLMEAEPDKKVLFIGHHDGAAGEQTVLAQHLRRRYPNRSHLLRVRVGHKPPNALETTLRSRSLVFLALGFYAARYYGAEVPLYACENGVIALNVPLTPSRAGSCSTRTMHPFFLESIVATLHTLGFTNPLINPLEFKTKGECLSTCRDTAFLKTVADRAVSCSHGTRRQYWIRRGANNCGYCVPCLFRRAAMHQAGLDNGLQYGFDVCESEMTVNHDGESADDLRAMIAFLHANKSDGDLAREAALIAPTSHLDMRAAMLGRGFEEVRNLIRAKGNAALRQVAGVGANEPENHGG